MKIESYKRCVRDGCDQSVSANKRGNRFCSFACRALNYELLDAQRVCEAVGPCSASAELWAAAVAMNDALTEYQRLDRKLFGIAQTVSITVDQWFAIKHPGRENQQ